MSREAQARGLGGWVRNRDDGTVEAVFSGDPEGVDALVEYCRTGPPDAAVDSVDVSEDDEQSGGFSVR